MMYSNKWSTFHGTLMSVTTNKQTAIYINLLAPFVRSWAQGMTFVHELFQILL
jgi:hypothetical protein